MERKTLVAAIIILAVLVVFSSFAGGMFLGKSIEQRYAQDYASDIPSVDKVGEVLQIIDHAYVDPVSDRKLVNGAVQGMVDAIGDPFTHYLDATHFKAFNEETSGHFDGIGVVVSEGKTKELVVVKPIEGTPAARAGIKANDVIVKIGDKATRGMDQESAVKLIKGKAGTKVTLTIRREGEKKLLTFTLVREQINVPNVTSKMLKNQVGYARIEQFNQRTGEDLKKEFDKLSGEGMKGFILDLRQNPGGIVDEAVNVGSQFIQSGPIVKIKSKTGQIDSRDATGGADTTTPVVVLVDKGSASASEIVSGALQDYKRAVIVGTTTFGKASVQTVIRLSDGSGILLTTDHYLTPAGRMIHKKGIKPDVIVKFKKTDKTDVQLEKAQQVVQDLISGKMKLEPVSPDQFKAAS
ncbi:MAG TPA: S41 family peptidase [Candidatus Aquicultor sp.]